MTKEEISISKIEKLAYGRDYEELFRVLIALFDGLDKREIVLRPDWLTDSATELGVKSEYTRIAAAISCMLCDPQFVLTDQQFVALTVFKNTLSSIFEASSFNSMSHIFAAAVSAQREGGPNARSDQLKGLFAVSVDSEGINPRAAVPRVPEDLRAAFWLGLIDRSLLVTKEQEANWWAVALEGESLVDCKINLGLMGRVEFAWMNCSYFDSPKKHHVKATLNRIIENTINDFSVTTLTTGRELAQLKKRPRILVCAEAWKSDHAMYRCYAGAMASLKEKFEIVLMVKKGYSDKESEDIFDDVVSFDNTTPYEKIVEMVNRTEPDLVYYPSLGMDTWTVVLAQLRLAPIQLMTLGHPATSMSDKIDYVMVPGGALGDPEAFSETVVCLADNAVPMVPHPHLDQVVMPTINYEVEKVKVAVPSIGFKITPAFLNCLEQVAARVSRPLEFHFFPNLPQVQMLLLKQHIEKLLPCKLHGLTDYVSYMSLINQCDLQVSPFPFGNSNGYIDGVLMALPIVSMDGTEVHSRIDNWLGKKAGLPSWCLTENPKQYVDAIVRLVDNDQERIAISEGLLNSNLRETFFDTAASSDFANTVHWIYECHEAIQGEQRKKWHVEDRKSFAHLGPLESPSFS